MKSQRIVSFIIVIAVFISMMPLIALPVSAASYKNTYVNTGDFRKDIIGVAKTQIGYREGTNNDTKYGDWFGLPNNPWCAMFVSWCAAQANIPEDVLKRCARASPEAAYFDLDYYTFSQYKPTSGDLFFTKGFTHVGLVYYVDGDYFYTIEGNSNFSGSSEGEGVVSNKRRIKDYYFAIPGYDNDRYFTLQYQLNGAVIANSKTYDQYKVLSSNGVNLRAGAGTGNSVLLAIPQNTVITITETKTANGYTWGKTTYSGKTGWCVISESWTQKIGAVSAAPYKINGAGLLCDSATGDVETLITTTSAAEAVFLLSSAQIGMEKSGYLFAGWKTSFKGGIFVADGEALDVTRLSADNNVQNTIITLQAVWVPAQFYLSYHVNGGSIRSGAFEINNNVVYNKNSKSLYYQYWYQGQTNNDGLINASGLGVYKRGHTFKGWSSNLNGGKVYDQNQAMKASTLYGELFGNTTTARVYAVWEPNVLKVRYHANGGTLDSTTYMTGANGICKKSTNTIYQQKWTYNQTPKNGLVNCTTFGLSRSGYTFIGWSKDPSGGRVYHMDDVNLLPTDLYSEIQSSGGTITLYARWVPAGHTHAYTDYQYNHDATSAKNGTETGTCSCGASHIRTKAGTILQNSATLYSDVEADAWYTHAMDYAVTVGFLKGGGNGTLMPQKKMTRAEFVQILASLSGIDTAEKVEHTGFSDVSADAWYASAVKWAGEKGLVAGTGGGKFSPNDYLTREQLCTLLVRYAQVERKVTLHLTDDYDLFTDEEKISSWAKTQVYACHRAGLVSGVTENEFSPLTLASRAQVAVVMMRFHQGYIA